MDINDDFKTLSDVEINLMIERLRSVQKDRADAYLKSIRTMDSVEFKRYLDNQDNLIKKDTFKYINPENFNDVNFDFFKTLMNSSNGGSLIDIYLSSNYSSKNIFFKQMMNSPKLTQYFIENHFDLFKKNINSCINYPIENTNILELLFSHHIIELKHHNIDYPDNEGKLLKIHSHALVYGFEHGYIEKIPERLLMVAYHGFANFQNTQDLYSILNMLSPDNIFTFEKLQESLWDVYMSDKNEKEEKIRAFLEINNDIFQIMLTFIKIPLDYIVSCLEFINELERTDHDDPDYTQSYSFINKRKNFLLLINQIATDDFYDKEPTNKFLDDIGKNKKLNSKFKQEIKVQILNSRLERSLIQKEDSKDRRIKI